MKIKKIIAGILAFSMLFGVANADNGVISEMVNTVLVSAEELTLENGLSYEVNGDGTGITITNCDKTKTEIVIPAEIDGLPVTSIGCDAFSGCTNLAEITIPDSVTSIGWSAFYNCTGLTKITIPDSVTEIETQAFSKCTGLTDVKLSENIETIYLGTFMGCTNLSYIKIPASVKNIEYQAFENCGFNVIVIPSGVESIKDWAIGYNYDITTEKYSKVKYMKIYGIKGSEAERYAIENEFNFVEIESTSTDKTGDLDGDGEITSNDSLNLLQLVVGGNDLTEEQKKLADLDGDGEITSSDALIALQIVVGLR